MVIEKEASESKPVDVMGALKFAGIIVIGLLTIIGLGWEDIFGFKEKGKPVASSKKASSKDDEDTQADYEKEYLDEDISEDALDRHEGGITA